MLYKSQEFVTCYGLITTQITSRDSVFSSNPSTWSKIRSSVMTAINRANMRWKPRYMTTIRETSTDDGISCFLSWSCDEW